MLTLSAMSLSFVIGLVIDFAKTNVAIIATRVMINDMSNILDVFI
jgi:hypothetical protein